MAQLIYNGIDLGRELRTISYSVEPVMDPMTGIDILYQHVTIEVAVVINPYWLATSKPGNLPEGEISPGKPGDRMGITLANLRRILMEPRGKLVFNVGPDTSLVSPQIDPDTDDDPLPSDCRNGPIPKYCRVQEIIGDKTGFLFFGIETWVEEECETFVLSNRWQSTCQIDQEGYTTRVTHGLTCFRSDFMHWKSLTPDNFRQFVVVPTQDNLRRISASVAPSADGLTLDWQVTDREVTYGVGNRQPNGPDSRITRIEGNTTHGGQIEIKDMKDVAKLTVGTGYAIGFGLGGLIMGPLGITGSVVAGAGLYKFLDATVPSCRANCLVRVFGQRRCPKPYMARAALQVALDRYGGIIRKGEFFIVGAYLMQDIGSDNAPFIELRLEFLTSIQQMMVVWNPDIAITESVRLDTELTTLGCLFDTDTPALPYSEETRGSWLGALAYQALSVGCPDITSPLPTSDEQPIDVEGIM